MRRRIGLWTALLVLACAGPGGTTNTTQPDPDPARADALVVTEHAPAPALGKPKWPRFAWSKVGAESHPLPGVRDVTVAADGKSAWVLTEDTVWSWTFGSAPERLGPADGALALAASGFGEHVYAVIHRGDRHVIERWTPKMERSVLFESDGALSDLVTSVSMWDGEERLFFAHTAADSSRIVSIRSDGSRRYEVTAPSGRTALTDNALLAVDPDKDAPPELLAAASAIPLSFDARLGSLLWRDGAGAVHRYSYGYGNWGADAPIGGLSAQNGLQISPNGWLSAQLDPAGVVRLVDPKGVEVAHVSAPGGKWSVLPSFTPDGRTLVGATAEGVLAVPVDHPLAPVRWLKDDRLVAEGGLLLKDTKNSQIYHPYEDWLYSDRSTPVFASIDGMLEVLHASFEAVFLRSERERSVPALRAFAEALKTKATADNNQRIADIASVTLQLLDNNPVHPDARAATDARGPDSTLHPSPNRTDWSDFVPRGPYANDPVLQSYFRAFKYLNLTELTEEERTRLAKDAAITEAHKRWISVQDPFLQGSRDTTMFSSAPAYPKWVRPRCITEPKTRFFPLSWGIDSEIIDRVVAHDAAPDCGVPYRGLPSGLDLLIGLGSPWASGFVTYDAQTGAALKAAHTSVVSELGKPIDLPGVVPGWLRIVQILGTDKRVPEGVDAQKWRGRLAETALASWTSLRHTMVLVNATTAAEAGEGGEPIFETLTLEPPTHAVDPVPEAWKQLAAVLSDLEREAAVSARRDRLVELIGEASATADQFADFAVRQRKGQPLTEQQYDQISEYGRIIEHPFVLLKTAAAGKEALSNPEPMTKVVDVHVWNEPNLGTSYWHVGVGHPREITVLAADRGILLPAEGAVYSYYEYVDERRLDDATWREKLAAGQPRPPVFSPAQK